MALVGEGVFETLKVQHSQPFAFTRHFHRMAASAERVGMTPPDIDNVRASMALHLADNPLPLGRLRIDWVIAAQYPALSITSRPIPTSSPSATLVLDEWTVNEHGPRAGIKSTRYENFASARQRANSAGCDDALLTNRADLVCETSTANVFYVIDGELRTPSLASGCLPGIARGLVIELCDVAEVDAPPTALTDASEIFITSSLREVQPVSRIGDQTYAFPGPRTLEARDAWERLAATTWDPPLTDASR